MPRTLPPRLPSIAALAADVLDAWRSEHIGAQCGADTGDAMPEDGPCLDVRLVVTARDRIACPGMAWLAVGSPEYDTVHGDWCGAACIDVTARPTRRASRATARALLEDVRDQIAASAPAQGGAFYQRTSDGAWCVSCATCGAALVLRRGDAGGGNRPQGAAQGIAHCYACDHATQAGGQY